MADNNTDEFPAGPKLDALVAEKVMGWTKRLAHFHPRNPLYWFNSKDERQHNVSFWSPSTDIAAAWDVITAEREKRWTWAVYQCDDSQWFAEVRRGWRSSYDSAHPAWADTAPLAICHAALAAVERGGLGWRSTPEEYPL